MMRRFFNICLWACSVALVSCINDPKVKSTADNTPSEDKGVLVLNVATRTTEGQTQRDYTLCIYKNEEGKQTLVRKYDSSNEEMLKPEYIWLLEGNYHAVVESGKAVAKTFNKAEQYFFGEKSFDIKGGETSTLEIVATMQNIPVEVIFDQTITDGFNDGFKVDVNADNELLSYTESKVGYFIMPEGCTTLSWNFVGTFVYDDGEQAHLDKKGTIENVEPKHAYKLSFKFSKDAAGFLDNLSVVVDESIEERDDHISFNPDPELKGVGFDLAAPCSYAGGDRRYVATSPAEFCAVSITSGDKEFNPVDSPVAGVTLTGLNTSQLFITLSEDFFYSLNGGSQIIELCVTDTSGGEARKDLPYTLPGVNDYDKSTTDLWNQTASLSATIFGTPSDVAILYREGEGEWQRSAAVASGTNTYTAQVSGISAGHTYEYSLEVGGKKIGANAKFTTEQGSQIPNGNLETWSSDGKYPGASSSNKYWDTGNEGTSMGGVTLTTKKEDVRPGSTGSYSAFLDSQEVSVLGITKFGAGNLFIGDFGETIINLSNPGATVIFGQPFDYNAKPKGIKFWVKYNCGSINHVGSIGQKGDPDLIKIFACVTTATHTVDSTQTDTTTFSPSPEDVKANANGRYDKVLYYGYFETTTSKSEWHEMYIPFDMKEGVNPAQKGTHLMFTATCSGYGDYFTGSTDSWMYIDDVELVY